MPQRSGRNRYGGWCLVAVVLCVLVSARWSIGLQAVVSAAWAWPGVRDVPRQCGSDGRMTWLWMNPSSFNDTFFRRGPAPRPLFLVGCGHSGTTPLVSLLALHPEIWVYAPNAALEYSVKPNSFRAVGFAPSRRDDAHFRKLARREGGLNASRWLVKSPSNACRLGYIFRTLGGDARIVALVRDGRDVMLSLVERYPLADPAGPLCLGRWVNDNTALLLYERDPRLLVLRYEDLFLHPNRGYPTLKRLLAHAAVAREPLDLMMATRRHGGPALTTSYRRDNPSQPLASDNHTLLRAIQISRPFVRSAPRWPTQMTPHLERVFRSNRNALELLAYFGYVNSSSDAWATAAIPEDTRTSLQRR
ncbi:hypothetical protein CTAYLR_000290 [Chrysophaeum taylorii]|uniref:Sulfotransferase n=1 Tax=Chrysophaeum taylorii TaxID=2483200 RepID=A0AAD7UEQ2_9STRA|nr:hypothetical protein CTAYLR_000290 [Chrysophaeum taylorii]